MEEKDRMLLRLSAASETISMDRKKKSRSFQNPDMTYQQILNKIIESYPSLDSNWIRAEEKIREPILQYEETDWDFLLRLSSHFHTGIVGRRGSGGTMLSLSREKGNERTVRESEIIGWEDLGYSIKKKAFHRKLAGVSLEGTVKRVEDERVYIQLDIDQKEGADYPWRWTPYTNHFSYCMPETDTRVCLYFPIDREAGGQAVIGRFDRNKSRGRSPQNREFMTPYQKRLGLFPTKLFLEGKEEASCLALEDASCIQIKSKTGISLSALGKIRIAGKHISVTGPTELVCRTSVSNIELCRDINLFAPSRVQTIGAKEERKTLKEEMENRLGHEEKDEAEGWQAVHAMMEVMDGKKEGESSFPQVFKSMDNHTVKGGYLLPEREE